MLPILFFMNNIKIFPSLISADLLNLEHEIKRLEPLCDGLHIDVMDNHFVPNLTWGHMFVNSIANVAQKTLSVHLMIDDVDHFLPKLKLPPQTIVSFHTESVKNFENTVNFIKEKKWVPSIAISPKIELKTIFPLLNGLRHVLLMSVEPGFSGQQFLPNSIDRLKSLTQYTKKENLELAIAMDGGINKTNIVELAQLGATEFCIASGIFSEPDPIQAIKELYKITQTN